MLSLLDVRQVCEGCGSGQAFRLTPNVIEHHLIGVFSSSFVDIFSKNDGKVETEKEYIPSWVVDPPFCGQVDFVSYVSRSHHLLEKETKNYG